MAITITSKYNHENCFFFWKWYELWPCISSYCANLVKWQKKDLYSNELKSSAKKLWRGCESRVNTEKSARPPAGRRTTRELLRRLNAKRRLQLWVAPTNRGLLVVRQVYFYCSPSQPILATRTIMILKPCTFTFVILIRIWKMITGGYCTFFSLCVISYIY